MSSSSYTNLKILAGEEIMEVVKKIDVTALIQEVKKYPVLYNNTPKHWTHSAEKRRQIWDIIAKKLCGSEQYQEYDDSEKEALVKEIQLKWKYIKDNYHRILRKEKEDEISAVPPYKRKKYIYYDVLEFLKPFAPCSRSGELKDEIEMEGGKNAPNIIYINETNDSEDDAVVQPPTPTTLKPVKVAAPVTPITPIPSFGTLQPVQFIQLQPNPTVPASVKEESEDGPMSKLSIVLEQMVKAQEEEKNDDPMGNKKFLLSLVPFLRKLSDDVNMEVRLQIMAVIQSYVTKELF